MPSIVARATEIRGLIPAVDSRKKDGINLLSGKNYLFDADGPKSGFGDAFLTSIPLADPEYAQIIRVRATGGDRTFIATGDSLLEWVESSGNYVTRFLLISNTINTPYRWTTAIVNSVIFFCHPAAGILFIDVRAGTQGVLTSPGLPRAPISIDEDNGHLIVMDEVAMYWSGQNDGFNFTPAIGGPGFQIIGAKVPGDPIMVKSYGGGVLTFTTGGVMRSEFTGDVAVYRHRALPTTYRPVNPFCVLSTDDDTIIILDRRGLFRTRGQKLEPFTPLFNEFLKGELKKFSLLFNENVRIEWDELNQYLYLSHSLTDITPLYEKSFVLFPAADKWGEFNAPHYGIGTLTISSGSRRGAFQCYVDSAGRIKYFDDAAHRVLIPTDSTTYYYRPILQYPIFLDMESEHTVLSTAMRVTHLEESVAPGLQIGGGIGGYYDFDGATPIQLPRESLDAQIRIGYFRFTEDEYPDELSEVTDIVIASVVSGDIDTASQDYDVVPDGVDDEDYDLLTGGEDFGTNPETFINFDLRLITSMDGQKAFTVTIPTMIRFFNSARYYAAGQEGVPTPVGIWHLIELSTSQPGQIFHLRLLEINGILAGRLS